MDVKISIVIKLWLTAWKCGTSLNSGSIGSCILSRKWREVDWNLYEPWHTICSHQIHSRSITCTTLKYKTQEPQYPEPTETYCRGSVTADHELRLSVQDTCRSKLGLLGERITNALLCSYYQRRDMDSNRMDIEQTSVMLRSKNRPPENSKIAYSYQHKHMFHLWYIIQCTNLFPAVNISVGG